MKVELIVALIAGAVALASAGGTVWSSIRNGEHSDANERAIEQLKIDSDRLKAADLRRKEISKLSEPLARSAYDLQSRLYNILKQNLIEIYLVHGNDREKSYVTNNTVFLIDNIYAGRSSFGGRFNLLTSEKAVRRVNYCAFRTLSTACGAPTNRALCSAFLRVNKEQLGKPSFKPARRDQNAWATAHSSRPSIRAQTRWSMHSGLT